jgi:hypothetical protein
MFFELAELGGGHVADHIPVNRVTLDSFAMIHVTLLNR